MTEKQETAAITPTKESFSLVPSNLNEAMKFAEVIAKSDLAPKDFKGKPGNVLVAVQMGAELNIAPLQALQNIAVINGRATVWGDLFLAIIQGSPLYEWHKEWFDHEKSMAVCQMKRRGNPEPFVATFSVEDAKKAGLWGKTGPWKTYPKRMMKFRARGFCGRDGFSDVLKGIAMREEVDDYDMIEPQNTPSMSIPMPQRLSAKQESEADVVDGEIIADQPPVDDVPWPEDTAQESKSDGHDNTLKVDFVGDTKSGEKNGKQWEKTEITFSDGTICSTFSSTVADTAREACENCREVVVDFETKGKFTNIVSLEIAE